MSTLKVGAVRGVSASSDAITVANDGSCTANITNNLSNRNLIINGAMEVSQRGTSFTATGVEYTLDRFQHTVGSAYVFDTTTTQDSSAPDGFQKSLKITPDSTDTPSGSENGYIRHKLEGNDCVRFASGTSSAKKFVVSFYAKSASSNNNHQYTLQIKKQNSGGTFYHQNAPFTVTSSWQRFTFAFSADTSNNITTGTGEAILLEWHLTSGPDDVASQVTSWTSGGGNKVVTGQSNFSDNTSNEFYLTGVQLEASDSGVATDFEHRSFAQEALLCKRYYQIIKGNSDLVMFGSGRANGTSNAMAPAQLAVPLRASPTITSLNYSGWTASAAETASNKTPTVVNFDSTHNQLNLNYEGLAGQLTNARVVTISCNSGSNLVMDSEL